MRLEGRHALDQFFEEGFFLRFEISPVVTTHRLAGGDVTDLEFELPSDSHVMLLCKARTVHRVDCNS